MNQEDFNEKTLEALTQITETLTDIGRTRDAMYKLIQFEGSRIDSAETRIDILMSERDTPEVEESKIDLRLAVKDDQFMTGCGNIATYICKQEHEIYTHAMMIGDYTHTYTTEGKHNASGESTLDLVSMVDCQVNDTENLTCGQLDKSQDLTRNSIISDALDRIADTTITPKALLGLGFTEEYQPPCNSHAGFIYYDFSMQGIDLLSNAVSNEEPLYVFFENQHEIHNLRKLGNLITALNEL